MWHLTSTAAPPNQNTVSVGLQGVDPGTWGKADAATMARRKVIKVRRGAAPPPEQPAEAAAAAAGVSNPFAGVSMTAATAPTDKPFAGISLAAAAAAQVRLG